MVRPLQAQDVDIVAAAEGLTPAAGGRTRIEMLQELFG